MNESVYTDEQLDEMSQDELKAEYERVKVIENVLWDNVFEFQGEVEEADHRWRIDRHYRRYGNLIGKVETHNESI